MSNRVKVVNHKGKKILVSDASGLKADEIIALFPEINQTGVTNNLRLYVMDVTNTHSNKEIQKASKTSMELTQSKVGKIHFALVGLSGMQKIIASAIDRDTYFASSMNDALDWLVAKNL